jgi:type I restriction enzyme S subunit
LTSAPHEQWPTRRIRFVTQRGPSDEHRRLLSQADRVTFLPMEAIGEQGELDLYAVREIEEVNSGYTQFFDGDVVVAKITPCFENGKGALISGTFGGVGFGTTELHVLTPAPELDGRFLYFITASAPFRRLGEASMTGAAGQKRVPEDFVRDFRIPVPPLPQQRAIADYLDRETARLDALVAAKERVLGLLAEKRRALITRAVTRGLPAEASAQAGLDPHAPLRDSGIPWLGEIPAHWSLCHLKRVLASIDYGISESVDATGSVAVLRMGDIRDGEVDYSNVGFVDSVEAALILRPSDLVFNRTNSLDQIGKVALFRGRADYPVSFASYLVRLRCGPRVLPDFLNWLLNSTFPIAWGRSEALPAIGQANLNPNRYGYLPMALPPLSEQQDIVTFIHKVTGKLDAVRAATERTIILLKERRAALIAAVVTGQIDVGGEPQ